MALYRKPTYIDSRGPCPQPGPRTWYRYNPWFLKAFDKVAHQRLIAKQHHYGIRGNTNTWLCNCLSHRTHQVVLNGSTSSSVQVTSGIPQGTVLGHQQYPPQYKQWGPVLCDVRSPEVKWCEVGCMGWLGVKIFMMWGELGWSEVRWGDLV